MLWWLGLLVKYFRLYFGCRLILNAFRYLSGLVGEIYFILRLTDFSRYLLHEILKH